MTAKSVQINRVILLLPLLILSSLFADTTKYQWVIPGHTTITSSFGEFRHLHFHGGIDVRAAEGVPILAPADGWVSRVSVSPWFYGKALYFSFDDSFTAVFGHLSRFAEPISRKVLRKQYKYRKYCIDLLFKPDELAFKKGDTIGFTGGTGAGKPHLHFELRKNGTTVVNPKVLGYDIYDKISPIIKDVALIPLSGDCWIEEQLLPIVISSSDSIGTIEHPVRFWGKIGVEASFYDLATPESRNRLGAHELELFLDDSLIFRCVYDSFQLRLTRAVGFLYDLEMSEKAGWRFHRFFTISSLPIYQLDGMGSESGVVDALRMVEGKVYCLRVAVADFNGHSSHREIFIVPAKPEKVFANLEPVDSNSCVIKLDISPDNVTLFATRSPDSGFVALASDTGNAIFQRNSWFTVRGVYSRQMLPNVFFLDHASLPNIYECSLFVDCGQLFASITFDLPPTTTPNFSVDNIPAQGQMIDLTHWLVRLPSEQVAGLKLPVSINAHFGMSLAMHSCNRYETIGVIAPDSQSTFRLSSTMWKVSLSIPSGAVLAPTALLGYKSRYRRNGEEITVFHFDPHTVFLFNPALLVFEPTSRNSMKSSEMKKLCIARLWNGGFYYIPTEHKGRRISAKVSAPGAFALIKDDKPPTVELISSSQLIFRVKDNFSGFKCENLPEMYINGRWVLSEYDSDEHTLVPVPLEPIGSGKLKVKIVASDVVGNKTIKRFVINRNGK